MRLMQERVWQRRGEQYLLIKSPPASGKSRALMFVALDGNAGFFTRNFTGFNVSTPRCFRWVRKYLDSTQLVDACGA
ncbi:MAG: hypothetical protein RLZZ536_2517 [Planctomycetota bacterium]|jgi:hypothetical protein